MIRLNLLLQNMKKESKWTLILSASICVLALILNLGITAGTDFHLYGAFTIIILGAVLFIYWLIKGLQREQWLFAFKVLVTPLLIIAANCLLHYDRIKMDGKRAELCSFFLGENSNYPWRFTHKAFRQIKTGMTKKEVIDLVGEPFEVWPYNYSGDKTSDTTGYKYCMDGLDTHHRVRIVLLQSDRVVTVTHCFYFD